MQRGIWIDKRENVDGSALKAEPKHIKSGKNGTSEEKPRPQWVKTLTSLPLRLIGNPRRPNSTNGG